MRDLRGESRDDRWSTTTGDGIVRSISSAARDRSKVLSKRRASHGSRSAISTILVKNEAQVTRKIGSKKESLANPCIKTLLMLYYQGSSLNDLWSPSGIETCHTCLMPEGVPSV